MFIIFEGGEFAGKTTQIKWLKKFLTAKGFEVLVTHEPGGGDPNIRKKLLDVKGKISLEEELELFLDDRWLHVRGTIVPALKQNKVVICDRFSPSTISYQGYGRGLDLEMIREKDAGARQGVWPDLIILLDGDPEVLLQRSKRDTRFEQEKMDFHHRVREGFLNQSKEDPSRWCVIDAERPLKEVWQEVLVHVKKMIKQEKDASYIREQ